MFTITCKSVVIQHRPFGSDIIFIEFEGPNPFPNVSTPPELIIHAAQNTGEDYVRKNFGVEPDEV